MTPFEPRALLHDPGMLAISVKANVRAANVMPELKRAAHARVERMTAPQRLTPRTIMIMAGGTGGHIFGSGRAPWEAVAARLTRAARGLACTEYVAGFTHGGGCCV